MSNLSKYFQPGLALSIAIVLQIIHLRSASSQPLSQTINVSTARKFAWAWYYQLGLGSIGIVFNYLCLSTMLSLENSSKMSFYSLNICINLIDFAFALGRVVYGSIYVYHGRFYGGSADCVIESGIDLFLLLSSVLAIIGMALVAKSELCDGVKVSERDMMVYMIKGFIYALIVTMVSIYIPLGGVEIQPSGTYCFIKLSSEVGAPIMYTFGWLGPLLYLFYNLNITFKAIKEAQKILEQNGIKEQAKGKYIKMVTKMGYFLQVTLNCYTPNSVGGLYQWCSQQHMPGWYSGFAGAVALLVPCLLNPGLFFYLNDDLRSKFWDLYGYHIARFLQYCGTLQLVGKILIGRAVKIHPKTRKLRVIRKSTASQSENMSSTVIIPIHSFEYEKNLQEKLSTIESGRELFVSLDYNNVNVWLTDPSLLLAFKEHGRKEYTLENFLFYEEAKAYYFKGLEVRGYAIGFSEYNMEGQECNISDDLQKSWNELEVLGNRLFSLYIAVPSAPLEINIPSTLQSKLSEEFEPWKHATAVKESVLSPKKKISDKTKKLPMPTFKYPSLQENFNKGEDIVFLVDKYVHIFDECVEVVKMIILTDIWPRFLKSNLKRVTMKEHKKKRMEEYDISEPSNHSNHSNPSDPANPLKK